MDVRLRKLYLDVRLSKRHAGGNAIDDAPDGRAVALAEGGDAEKRAKARHSAALLSASPGTAARIDRREP